MYLLAVLYMQAWNWEMGLLTAYRAYSHRLLKYIIAINHLWNISKGNALKEAYDLRTLGVTFEPHAMIQCRKYYRTLNSNI